MSKALSTKDWMHSWEKILIRRTKFFWFLFDSAIKCKFSIHSLVGTSLFLCSDLTFWYVVRQGTWLFSSGFFKSLSALSCKRASYELAPWFKWILWAISVLSYPRTGFFIFEFKSLCSCLFVRSTFILIWISRYSLVGTQIA